jgi:hypothetical protein
MLGNLILPSSMVLPPEIFAQIMLESSKRISACKGFGISVSSIFTV